MIPFTVPQIELKGFLNFSKAFIGGQWNKGRYVQQLEEEMARFLGVRYAVAFASGRYALYLLYKYFGCEGKRVIVPAYTCIPAADAFRWAGAEPFFVDIELETYNPKYDESIKSVENIGAISLSYLYGLVGDIMPFVNWARSRGIPVIEDAAIALGARANGKMIGSIGDAGVFSLQSSKIITAWRGGVATTNDIGLYKFLKQHQEQQGNPSLLKVLMNGWLTMGRRSFLNPSVYGMTVYPVRQATLKPRVSNLLKWVLDQNPGEGMDGNSPADLPSIEGKCFTNAQAALALTSFRDIDNILALRRRYAAYLTDKLKAITCVAVPASNPHAEHAWGRFPIRIEGITKPRAVKAFARLGVEVGLYYPYIIPQTKHFRGRGNYDTNFPNARKAAASTVLLPFYPNLNQQDLDNIVFAVRKISEEVSCG